MSLSYSRRKNLLNRTALALPFFCFAIAPAAAQVVSQNGDIIYNAGSAALQSESNLTGNVIIESGANVSVQNQVKLNFNANNVGVGIDQSLNLSGPNANLVISNSGSNSTQVTIGGTLESGASGQSGILSITNGAQMVVDANNTNGGVQAAFAQGSTGSITVDGQGSSLQTPYLTIGSGGTGSLNVTNGASVTADFIQVGAGTGSSGVINVSNATLISNDDFYTNSQGTGTVNINNGGIVVIKGVLEFGYSGALNPTNSSSTTGTINLNQGGILEVSGAGGTLQNNSTTTTGVIGTNEGPNGSYAFNFAGGTFKVINSGFTTNVNATLVQNTNSTIDTNGYNLTFGGVVSGAGGLIKAGAGTLILTGNNSYTGGTTISNGIIQIGTSAAPVNYNTATNGPLTIFVTPNNTPGTGYGQLQVDGHATLGGTLNVSVGTPAAGSGYAIGSSYRLVTATNGVSGHFSNVNVVGPYAPYLTTNTFYESGEADVELLASNSTLNTGRFYASQGYAQNASLFNILSSPMQVGAGYWLHGLGSFGHAPGVNYNYKGFVIGRGFTVNPHLIIGGAISNVYTHTADGNSSFVNGTSFGAEGYGIYTLQNYTFTGVTAIGHLGNRATRYLPGIGAGKFATNGTYEGVSLRMDYAALRQGPLFVTPYASISYVHTQTGRGQETGLGMMNIAYGQVRTNLAQAGGGLTGGYTSMTSHGILTGWAGVGGIGTLGNGHSRVDETIGTQNASVTGQIASTGAFTPSVGVRLAGKTAPWTLAATWQGQISSRASGQAFDLEGSYKF